MKQIRFLIPIIIILLSLPACSLFGSRDQIPADQTAPTSDAGAIPSPTPLPTRPLYNPGELVEYTAQTGDTLPALAAHFNTSVERILKENPIIPKDATTLPAGLPMQIPIYYRSFWGPPYQIIPDSQYVNGPAAIDFNTDVFIAQYTGWLNGYREYAGGKTRSAGGVIDYVAQNFSISPRLLLALIEYRAGGLTQLELNPTLSTYPLGYRSRSHRGLYLQLVWAANQLNNGYYGWRTGDLIEFDLADGETVRPDPWQNAGTVALQYLFNQMYSGELYDQAIGPLGYAQTFKNLYGDLWENDQPHIPGSLEQPLFTLPFEPGLVWAYTGAPHTAWGTGAPFAAMDFAPPSRTGGCFNSQLWATAIAPGLVVRSEIGVVMLDLDKDGDERTGWVILYLHVGNNDRVAVGEELETGGHIGHPSCEGGTATGTHIHVARKYNGEWIVADSPIPFVMEGWIPHNGDALYLGTLTRYEHTVIACDCANQDSQILATGDPNGAPTSLTP
jgi:LasA protease